LLLPFFLLTLQLATDEKTPFEQICTLFQATTGAATLDDVATHYNNNLKVPRALFVWWFVCLVVCLLLGCLVGCLLDYPGIPLLSDG
jgi:hypothetical protein